MDDNEIRKVFADPNGAVLLICRQCGATQNEKAQAYKDIKGPVSIKCRCGNAYKVKIEFRQHYRKETRLEGMYSLASNPSMWGKIVVKNISMQGCGFETLKTHLLHPDEEIRVKFQLNDAKKSLIMKKLLVCYMDKNYVGGKFQDPPGNYDPDLGFYLRTA